MYKAFAYTHIDHIHFKSKVANVQRERERGLTRSLVGGWFMCLYGDELPVCVGVLVWIVHLNSLIGLICLEMLLYNIRVVYWVALINLV